MKTKIFAHRGSKGKYPENTLLSFEKALHENADGIELDVHLTKDGEVAVIHDEKLERTTNGKGYVKDFTLAELKKLNAGDNQQIPTLAEVFTMLGNTDTELNIELKTGHISYNDIESKVLSVADKYSGGRNVIYSSFHLPTLIRLKKLNSQAKIAWLLHMQSPLPNPADYIETLGLEALHLEKGMVLSNPAHYRDIYDKLRVWTVNDENEIKELIKLGVGAIITDFPDIAAGCII